MKEYGVRYQVFDNNDRLSEKEKNFKTKAELDKFVDQLEENPRFHMVLAFSEPSDQPIKETLKSKPTPKPKKKITIGTFYTKQITKSGTVSKLTMDKVLDTHQSLELAEMRMIELHKNSNNLSFCVINEMGEVITRIGGDA